MCLVDNCSSNTVLREIKYFQTLTKREGNVLTITGCDAMIVDSGRATIVLPMGSAAPTKRHWVGGKKILRYLNGTKDLGLFYQKNQDPTLVGYTDAGYLSYPHNARSQTYFVFLHGELLYHECHLNKP